MKQTKKHLIWQVIVVATVLVAIFSIAFIKKGIVSATKIMGKQQNYNMEAEEQTTIEIEQNIEKYLKPKDNQMILQQKIVVNSNKDQINKQKLQIEVPNIQEKEPQTINILVDGKRLAKENYNYNAKNKQLNIETTQKIDTYKIMYTYPETDTKPKEIQLSTKAYIKVENEEEKEAKDEQKITLQELGKAISIEEKMTKQIYKGYLYEAKENETIYGENYIVEISNIQDEEEIEIIKEKEKYTYYINNEKDENQTKIENDIKQSTYFKQTTIKKEQMLDILGQDGVITIKNEQNEIIEEITKDTIEDENGYVIIKYPSKETKEIKIHMTKPVNLGEIKIYNKKAIDSNIGYTKEEIQKFQNLENTIKLNETTTETKMELLDTKTESKISMEKNELSTLQNNENVQIMVTLLSNSNQYDLYKNPKIDIIFPKELDINVKSISQLNYEEQMQIKEAKLKENVLTLGLEGEQINYSNNTSEGIQIAIIADINISKTTPTKDTNIQIKVTNENRQGEFKDQYSLKIKSKNGVLMLNKVENYNQAQETKETIDSQEEQIMLETYSNEKIANQTIQIINNYENAIKEVSIIGTITENNIDLSFKELKLPENKNAKIYYLDSNNEWKENIEEKVKTYKIVLEGKIKPGEAIQTNYSFYIPENLQPKSTSNIKTVLQYKYSDNEEKTVSNIKFTTKEQPVNDFLASKTVKEENGMKVEIMAISGGKQLKDGDTVKEGQGIRYKIRVTNETNSTISNIALDATNTNAIYYDKITYEEEVDGVPYTKYKIEEVENLKSKQLKIDTLNPGETKEISYQISIKEVEDNNQNLTGEIKIKAKNYEEKTIQNITNKIEKGDIRATLKFLYSEDVVTCEGSGLPLAAYIKNISNQELQDVIVEMPIDKTIKDVTNEDLFLTGEENYEFLEYKDRVLKFKIPKIKAQETIEIVVKLTVGAVDLSKTEETIVQHFKAKNKEKEYISNDIERPVLQSKIELTASQTTNIKEKNVKDKDKINFTFTIENKGIMEKEISITDKIPYGLDINSIKLKTSEKEEQLESDSNLVIINTMINPEEIIELEIETTVNTKKVINEQIENYATIEGINAYAQTNKLAFVIQKESNNNNNPSDNNNSNNSDNNNNNVDNSDKNGNNNDTNTYSISGIAWIDSNSNGMQESEEVKIPNMPVLLINMDTGEDLSQITNEDGSYTFKNLQNGKYTVIFQYDTNKYTITTYQKEGVAEYINSDVINSTLNVQNKKILIAKTKTLTLETQNLENIDAGFIENKKFDLKLDKTITQVTVKTAKGTKTNNYDQSKLAKIEIDAKQIANSQITIKYNIAVTNNGEIAGYANEIIDELPKEVSISQEASKTWYKLQNGTIATKQLANQIINPGETKNITLTVNKKMTGENTGTITNKVKCANSESQAELIVSIKTGGIILYISIAIISISIIAIGVYFIKTKVLKQVITTIIVIIMLLGMYNCVKAATNTYPVRPGTNTNSNQTTIPDKEEAVFACKGRHDTQNTDPPKVSNDDYLVDGIYRAMYKYREEWLDVQPTKEDLTRVNWKYWPHDNSHNGYIHSMVASTGGLCVGHGQQASGGLVGTQRKIGLIDIPYDNEDERYDYLAYAILYSTQCNEHATKAGEDELTKKMVGRQAIMTWMAQYSSLIPGLHAQIGHEGKGFDARYTKYNSKYGKGLKIGDVDDNAFYENVQSYINSKNAEMKLDEEKMKQDKNSGIEPKIIKREDDYILIGPYHLEVIRSNTRSKLKCCNRTRI